jgi:trk system potassium uptake protein TrkH
MIPFADDTWLLATLGILTILGGLGYAIVGDVIARRGWRRLSLEAKLVLTTTALLLVGGTIGIAVFEWTDPETLGSMPESQRILNAAFMSASLRSAGFASFDVGAMAQATLAISVALMFIGGASGSTAGGIKVNTFSILFVAIASTARGRPFAEAFGRRIEHLLIYRAMSVALLAMAIVFGTAMGIALLAPGFAFDAILFEAMSAFGTVGMSTGITPDLPPPAQIIITLAMYLGRLGPLTFVFWLIGRSRPAATLPAIERMRIG